MATTPQQRRDAFAANVKAGTNPQSSNAKGRERDARIMRLALIGPVWKGLLHKRLRFFTSRQACDRRIEKLEEDGRLKHIGRARIDDGPKVNVWSNRNIGRPFVQHETDLLLIFYSYWPHAFGLAGKDADPAYLADMDLTIGGKLYRVEMNEETEPHWQIKKRLEGYKDCPNAVLFVTLSPERVPEILTLTDNPRVYVSTLEQVIRDPWGTHWKNRDGEPGNVAKPVA